MLFGKLTDSDDSIKLSPEFLNQMSRKSRFYFTCILNPRLSVPIYPSIYLIKYQHQEESTEPPAVVIYMVDPLSFVTDNPSLVRLSSLALMRCFHAMVPKISTTR